MNHIRPRKEDVAEWEKQPPAAEGEGMFIPQAVLRRLDEASPKNARMWIKRWINNEIMAQPIVGPTEKPPGVRLAGPADEAALLDLMMRDVSENAMDIAAPCPERIMEHIQMATRQGRMGLLPVIDGPDGKPVACMLLVPFQWWWSKAYFLQEVWNYVHPDHRLSKHAHTLMLWARWASDNFSNEFGHRVYLFQGVTSKDSVRAKVSFYSRFTNYMGALFIYPNPKISYTRSMKK
jgi:hypothetical protein